MAGLGLIGSAIAGGMQGFGAAAGGYAKESFLEAEKAAVQKLRDERLDEMQRMRDVRTDGMARQREIDAEERKRAPGIRAAKAAEGLIASGVQTVNQGAADEAAALAGGGAPITAQTKLSDKDEAAIKSKTYGAEGLSEEALRFSQEARQIGRDEKETEWRTADRVERRTENANRSAQDERQHSERMAALERQIKQQGAQIGLESRKVDLLESVNALDVEQKKVLAAARDAYVAEQDPEKKVELGNQYMTLMGKMGERFKPIESVDPVTGQKRVSGFFDSASGRVIGPGGKNNHVNPIPMPQKQSELKVGSVYQTARGLGKWNGTTFDPVAK